MDSVTLVVFIILFGIGAAVHLLQAREWTRDRSDWTAERARLLDRIMARNYNEFVHSVTATTTEVPQMTSDEAESAWHDKNKAAHPDLYPDE